MECQEIGNEVRLIAREKGPLAGGQRHGDWELVRHEINTDRVGVVHQSGAYANGKRHGTWVESTHHVRRAHYDRLAGDATQGEPREREEAWHRLGMKARDAAHRREREEGWYINGVRHGSWTIIDDWVDLHGMHTDAEEASKSVRCQGAYAEGRRDGVWIAKLGNGREVARIYVHGALSGSYEAQDSDESLLAAMCVASGKTGL